MLRDAVVCFQYAERIKSELIIATKLLEQLETLKDSELEGAKKLMLSFLGFLESEIKMARRYLDRRVLRRLPPRFGKRQKEYALASMRRHFVAFQKPYQPRQQVGNQH